ncbi:MAG: hypothetical protein ABIK79_10930 [Chloroflexota bacterium]
MSGSTKTVGAILIVAAIIIGLVSVTWLVSGLAEENLRKSGLMLGLVIVAVLVLPLLGGGIFLILKSRGEASHMAELQKEKRLLNMIQTQGQISLGEAALELDVSRETLKSYVYDLVGKQLFSGYVNWDQGMLYSSSAASMGSGTCPNCGGKLESAGKGVIQCPYCGIEIFQ